MAWHRVQSALAWYYAFGVGLRTSIEEREKGMRSTGCSCARCDRFRIMVGDCSIPTLEMFQRKSHLTYTPLPVRPIQREGSARFELGAHVTSQGQDIDIQ